MASSPQKNLQFISPPKEAGDFLQNQVKVYHKRQDVKMWISKVDKLCTSLKNGYFMLCLPVHTFPQCIHILWKTRRNGLSTFSQDLCTFSVPFVRPVSLACQSRFSSIFTRDTHLSAKVIHISAVHLLKVCT